MFAHAALAGGGPGGLLDLYADGFLQVGLEWAAAVLDELHALAGEVVQEAFVGLPVLAARPGRT
ncbi:hypothetical protein AB0N06_36165 [Streptomyces sp. NPDC051020]|uniref:hypothetical protein n=1 Tax=Streptomyces sp. NPDC051020 TaxID=3155409 RepID=UPI00341FD451